MILVSLTKWSQLLPYKIFLDTYDLPLHPPKRLERYATSFIEISLYNGLVATGHVDISKSPSKKTPFERYLIRKNQTCSAFVLIKNFLCISGFFRTFLQKLTVLSDQEVPGCHKNIYRDLRPSFTRSEIFGNMCCLFRQQRQHSKISLWTGAPREALWKTVGKAIFSLFDLKNRFEVFHRPTT